MTRTEVRSIDLVSASIYGETVTHEGWDPTDALSRSLYQRLATDPYFNLGRSPVHAPVHGLVAAVPEGPPAPKPVTLQAVVTEALMLMPTLFEPLALEASASDQLS